MKKNGFIAITITLLALSVAVPGCVVDDGDVTDDDTVIDDDDDLTTIEQALSTCNGSTFTTTLNGGPVYGTATAPPSGYLQNLALSAALSAAGKTACSCPAGTTKTAVPGSFCGAVPSLTYCWKVAGTLRYWSCTATGPC